MDEVPLYTHKDHVQSRSRRDCRGTSLIRNNPPVGPYSSPMPREVGVSYERGTPVLEAGGVHLEGPAAPRGRCVICVDIPSVAGVTTGTSRS